MKLFDLDKWEQDGKAELDAHKARIEEDYQRGSESPRTWILIVTAACLVGSALFLGCNALMEAKGIGSYGGVQVYAIGAAMTGLVGIAYIVGILAGRTAASTRSMSLAENVITMICSALIALASVAALFARLSM